MDCEFVLPLQPQDLELATAQQNNGYQVQSKFEPNFMPESKLLSLLETSTEKLGRDFLGILHHSVFDSLYSVACASKFDTIGSRPKQEVTEALVESVNLFLRKLPGLKLTSVNHTAARPYRNAVKMHAFLLCSLASRAEKAEETIRVLKKPAPKSKAKSKSKKAAASEDENDEVQWEWATLKERVLGNLVDLADEQLVKGLWPLASPDKEFGTMMFQLSTSMLENKANFTAKSRAVSDLIFKLFVITVRDYSLVVRATTALTHLLHNFEHVPGPLAALLKLGTEQYGMNNLVASVVQEIGRLEVKFLARDNTGAKNIALFLEEIASNLPETILSYVPVLLPHLDGESYLIRNGIVRLLGQVIEKAFSENSEPTKAPPPKKKISRSHKSRHEGESSEEELDMQSDKENAESNRQDREKDVDEDNADEYRGKETLKKSREELFEILLQRTLDINSFTRSKVLQQFQHLAEAKCIPLARTAQVAELALARLQDKTVQVRKNAIQLLIAMLEYNVFGANLSLEPFATRAREGAENLKAKLLARNSQPEEPEQEDEGDELISDKAAIAHDEAENAQFQQEREALDVHFEAVKFLEAVNTATPILTQLLNSKTSSDILECIRFFVVAHEFQIDSAPLGIRKMLVLIWSKEPPVVEAVMEAYRRLYIGNSDFTLVREIQSGLGLSIARNLIRLPTGASMSYLTSLEELLSKMTRADLIPLPVIAALWDIFSNSGNDEVARLNSLTLLTMLSDSAMIIERLPCLVSIGLGPRASLPLRRMACIALQRISPDQVKQIKGKTKERLLQILVALLTAVFPGKQARDWYSAASEALNALFILSERPEKEAKDVLLNLLAQTVNGTEEAEVGNAELLSHLFFLVGHVAVKMLVYLESMEQRAKKARVQIRSEKMKREEANDQKKKDGDLEDELAVGASEEYEMEQLREEAEQRMVKGNDSLLGPFTPAVIAVCSQPQKYNHRMLQQSAVLALCKLMCISAEFCETNLRLLFTILTKSKDAASRSNILVALGDMSFRFPNLIEPWGPYMYSCLNDESVRKHALMVLTHLILNDMQKAKRPVADIAKCVVDPDPHISNLAKMFFNELALKGKNPVYNLLPDIISRLSNDNSVTSDHFRAILKFLITFIQKDKQTESLVEKLCHRFNQMDIDCAVVNLPAQAEDGEMLLIAAPEEGKTEKETLPEDHAAVMLKQCRDVAYCLAQLNFASPGAVKKLVDCGRLYWPKLVDKEIYESFTSLVTKAKKHVGIKPEQKQMLEDLSFRLAEVHEKAVDDQQAHYKASTARGKRGPREKLAQAKSDEEVADPPSAKRTKAPAPKRPLRRNKKVIVDDSEEMGEVSEEEKPAVAPKKKGARQDSVKMVQKPTRTKKVVQSSDSELSEPSGSDSSDSGSSDSLSSDSESSESDSKRKPTVRRKK